MLTGAAPAVFLSAGAVGLLRAFAELLLPHGDPPAPLQLGVLLSELVEMCPLCGLSPATCRPRVPSAKYKQIHI